MAKLQQRHQAPAAATEAHRTRFIDPGTLMRIKNLQMRAKVVVEGFYSGLHRSPYHGFSVEFTEYREYSAGDDLRYLDWRLYARSDRYYIKRFEDETNLRCYLLADMSRSMGYGSLEYTKADYARTVAATLGYFLSTQRDAVGLVTFHETLGEYLPARFRPGHMHQLMLCLEKAVAGRGTNLALPLEQIARTVTRRGVIVLISDLLAPVDDLRTQLGYLCSRGHEVIVFRVLDPQEIEFEFDAPALFLDLETGADRYVDPTEQRKHYQERFREHSEKLASICGGLGIDLVEFRTDRPLELTLFDFMRLRLGTGRQVTRQRNPQTGRLSGGKS